MAVGAVLCISIFQYSTLAAGYYSFGRTVNKSFGDPNLKDITLSEDIFVPISGQVLDIDLALNIGHTSICDLWIYLESPAGKKVCINSYDVHTFKPHLENFYWTIFDAESPFSIDSGKPPFTGLYRPNGPDSLTDLYGQQSYGTWKVSVCDTVYADTGIFKDVRLDFHINPGPLLAPEPSTILLFTFSAIISISRRKSSSL